MIRSLILVLGLLLAAAAPAAAAADDVREVQLRLAQAGYAVGKVDGKSGKMTAAAISQYETDWQLPVTGKISADLIARLTRQHAATRPQMQKVANGACQVWNAYPRARETITLKTCNSSEPIDGPAEVVWRWFERGDWQVASYKGDYRSGKMSGLGVLNYQDGHRYEGEFSDGQPHGNGAFEWARGNVYVGEWQDGKPHGQGVYERISQRFTGTWKQGCFSKGKSRIWLFTSKKACGFK
ncbi:MAG: peptidoglycan-binding protein [Rhizobiaceae bacterium]